MALRSSLAAATHPPAFQRWCVGFRPSTAFPHPSIFRCIFEKIDLKRLERLKRLIFSIFPQPSVVFASQRWCRRWWWCFRPSTAFPHPSLNLPSPAPAASAGGIVSKLLGPISDGRVAAAFKAKGHSFACYDTCPPRPAPMPVFIGCSTGCSWDVPQGVHRMIHRVFIG